MLSNQQKATELYRISRLCADRRSHNACNGMCQQCPLNADHYSNNSQETMLIKLSASIDNQRVFEEEQRKFAVNRTLGIFVCVFTIWAVVKCNTPKPVKVQTPAPTPSQVVMPVGPISNKPYEIRLYNTFQLIPSRLRDVNNDGVLNCIDYAVVFYEIYGAENGARIIRNINPETGMNHLFNSVTVPNGFIYTEPQAIYPVTIPDMYYLDTYDVRYNKDETDLWKRYAR